MVIEFHVAGRVASKGSMRAISYRGKDGKNHVALKDGNKGTRPWMALVKDAAEQALRGRPKFEGVALVVECIFALPRPAGHYGTGQNADRLKDSAPFAPGVKPDVDKAARLILDALEGVVFENDSRIVDLAVRKVYAQRGEPEGVVVLVRPAMRDEVRAAGESYSNAVRRDDMLAAGFAALGVGR